MSDDIDTRIQLAVREIRTDDAWRDETFSRVRDASTDRPRRRRVRHVRRAPLLAAAIVLVLAGAAAASQHERIQRIFAADDPIAAKVDQLRDDQGERPTEAEYQELLQTTMVPGVERIGMIRDDEMVQRYRLEPRDKARVLFDDGETVRVVAAPIVDGMSWCHLMMWYQDGTPRSGSGGCGGSFGPNGVAPAWGKGGAKIGDPAQYRVYGTASDDVTRMEVELDDGRREPMLLSHNVFVWTSLERPKLLHVWRGDRHDIERGPVGL